MEMVLCLRQKVSTSWPRGEWVSTSRRRERERVTCSFFYLERSDLFLGHEGSKGLTQRKVRVQFHGTTKRNYIGS